MVLELTRPTGACLVGQIIPSQSASQKIGGVCRLNWEFRMKEGGAGLGLKHFKTERSRKMAKIMAQIPPANKPYFNWSFRILAEISSQLPFVYRD